jgi:hypothetical protein
MSVYYHICPKCGAHLDPGERCDCSDEIHKKNIDDKIRRLKPNESQHHDQYHSNKS